MKYMDSIIYWNKLSKEEQNKVLLRPILIQKNTFKEKVKKIIKNIYQFGDKSLQEYTFLFDGIFLKTFDISSEKINLAKKSISKDLKKAILLAKNNIECFHESQIMPNIDIETQSGIRCQQINIPLNSIGIYIPGGTAPLFSTVLMLAIPAKIAKCKEIILCSPPPISDEILYTASLCGVNKIFQIGGAQAIAALSCGTQTIPKVDKIFGPGNAYVTEAKLQVSTVFNGPSIDMLAGPSELLIIADYTANPDFIAADFLSQLEHDISSQVIFVTCSEDIAKKVILSLNQQYKHLSRLEIIKHSLKNSKIIIVKNLLECVQISNLYAPEHLIIQTENPRCLLNQISNAGSIFLGPWSPESAGDYASGTNHVLPTYGKSTTDSALGVSDFQKRVLVQELTYPAFMKLSSSLIVLSSAEKLEAHTNAVKVRMNVIKETI
ncbi:histidinol dehydrogenase [Buchnera aphidicola]|uniref:histidinol dehydrogenase n=1 Tax=Buchnera aphidicola TaxID=9 RepID=UPI003BEEBDCC